MIPLAVIIVLAGVLAIFLGFKGRIVQTKGPRCPNQRCFYPLAASIERRAEQHEGVEYGYPIVCPECGRMTASPVEARWSYRKFRMRRVYLGLALLVIGAPLLIGTNMFRTQSPWMLRNLPTPILLHLATTGEQYPPRRELLRRVQMGEYTGAAADRIAERLMEVQTQPFFAMSPLAEALYTLVDANTLSPEVAAAAERSMWTFHLNVPAQVTPDARIPIEVIARYWGPPTIPMTWATPRPQPTWLVLELERVEIGERVIDLADRQPVKARLHNTISGYSAGVRFSLPNSDPWIDEAFAAPSQQGDYPIAVDAKWRVLTGPEFATTVILQGEFHGTGTVTVTDTPQSNSPSP